MIPSISAGVVIGLRRNGEPSRTHPSLYNPIVDSASALSKASAATVDPTGSALRSVEPHQAARRRCLDSRGRRRTLGSATSPTTTNPTPRPSSTPNPAATRSLNRTAPRPIQQPATCRAPSRYATVGSKRAIQRCCAPCTRARAAPLPTRTAHRLTAYSGCTEATGPVPPALRTHYRHSTRAYNWAPHHSPHCHWTLANSRPW